MTGYVIDSCAVAEVLMKTRLGDTVAGTIRDYRLFAPELIDAEVLSTLRQAVNRKTLSESDALTAVQWLTRMADHAFFTRSIEHDGVA